MALAQRIAAAVRDRLLAVSTYQPPPQSAALELDSPEIESRRSMLFGGLLTGPLLTQSRWYLEQLEEAEHMADNGNLMMLGKLMNAARRDGVLSGVLSTRTGGLVRLPKRFRGDDVVVQELEAGHDSIRSTFDEMLPPAELALMAGDGIFCGVAVGELLPVKGRKYPVLVRHDPRNLYFRWTENRWYLRSVFGDIAITPGDGRWVLHMPGGRIAPWANGQWRAIGRAYIRKDHAQMNKDIWEMKLAHPARVAQAPQAASEQQTLAWFKQVMAWGRNTVFATPPGYEVKIIESNGRGADSFLKTIQDSNTEMIIAIAGQTVTTTGGDAAFQNSDIHRTIRADLIKETADGLAYTINTQCIPVYIALVHGADAVDRLTCTVEWDVTPPKDRNSEATSLVTAAAAIKNLDEAVKPNGLLLNVPQMCERFAIPVTHPDQGKPEPQLDENGKPILTLIEGGASGDTIAPVDNQVGDDAAQDTALNGAQVASMMQIVQSVANGAIPRGAGIAMLKRAFNVTQEDAEEIMDEAGNGFVPKTAAPPTAAPTPKPDEAAA